MATDIGFEAASDLLEELRAAVLWEESATSRVGRGLMCGECDCLQEVLDAVCGLASDSEPLGLLGWCRLLRLVSLSSMLIDSNAMRNVLAEFERWESSRRSDDELTGRIHEAIHDDVRGDLAWLAGNGRQALLMWRSALAWLATETPATLKQVVKWPEVETFDAECTIYWGPKYGFACGQLAADYISRIAKKVGLAELSSATVCARRVEPTDGT
jgi:hypothetical protein